MIESAPLENVVAYRRESGAGREGAWLFACQRQTEGFNGRNQGLMLCVSVIKFDQQPLQPGIGKQPVRARNDIGLDAVNVYLQVAGGRQAERVHQVVK